MSAARFMAPPEAQELSAQATDIVIGIADAYPGHEDSIAIASAIALIAHAKTRNPNALRLFQIAFTHACAEGMI